MMEPWRKQGSPEWHGFRKGKIGSSSASAIMGENPFCSPLQLWHEMMMNAEVFVNDAMRRGTELEPRARRWYELETGEAMFPDVAVHENYNWMISSIDGINLSRDRGIEIKSPGIKNHLIAMRGEIPTHNKAQTQHHMVVWNLQVIDFVSYYEYPDRVEGIIIPALRNDEYIEELLNRERHFYQCMINKEWIDYAQEMSI